ncbi:hypothetical protein ACFSJY_09810 [Thalassotalea euphylliae]|uniref:hypothetical protein n=1 Tax=Thalassotalea euphylliae TaxID=1655234 RepID=UPI00363A52A6
MKKSLLATLVASTCLSAAASAVEINFNGYGSIRGGMTLDDDHFPVSFPYDDDIDFKSESLFALQTTAVLNQEWSAVLVMQARGEEDFDLEARWAYLNYQFSPETTLSFGRFALPYFRHSDTQDIGYSHNYTRMPTAIYRGQDFDVIEGVRVMHSTFVGDGDLTIKASFGAFDGNGDTALGVVDTELNNIIQFSADYTYEWFSIYAGALFSEISLSISPLLDANLEGALPGYMVENSIVFNPAGEAVYDMNDTYIDEDDVTYFTVGSTIDYNNWLLNLEFATSEIKDSFSESTEQVYGSVGYRFGDWVVTGVFEKVSYDYENDSASSQDPFVNVWARGVTDAFLLPNEYDAQGIHFRYDAAAGIAYKFEYTNVHSEAVDEDTGIVSFGLDFVF